MEIDNKLSWSPHIDKFMQELQEKDWSFEENATPSPQSTRGNLFQKTVVSGVSYCIPVWGACTPPLFNNLEEIHTKAARLIHDLPRDRDNTYILQKANWLPLSHMYKKAILNQVHQAFYQVEGRNTFLHYTLIS